MKKIALSALVIAASGVYVFVQSGAQPPDDMLAPAAQADEAPTGAVAGRRANAFTGQAATETNPVSSIVEVSNDARQDSDSQAGSREAIADSGQAASAPPAQPPSLPEAARAAVVRSAQVETATDPLPAAPSQPAPAPASPALAVVDVPLPRPRPEYRRLTRASAVRAVTTVAAATGLADGTYTGPTVDAYYGEVQVQAIVQGGRLTAIKVLRYPSDRRTSLFINHQALPRLRDEVIRAQSAHVDIVSGATLTSRAFIRSLDAALKQANA
jgi:uncharacterized protein with FMN-binding domain